MRNSGDAQIQEQDDPDTADLADAISRALITHHRYQCSSLLPYIRHILNRARIRAAASRLNSFISSSDFGVANKVW
jgi:hypothetical protein